MAALDFTGWSLAFLRRVLYSWVRVDVLPERVEELGLAPARPVCYVLHGRHLSNLLVLYEETRRAGLPAPRAPLQVGARLLPRSCFFLDRPSPLIVSAKARFKPSPVLTGLVEALREDPAADVAIVPVTLLWGRAPDKQQSILKALFAETWRAPGLLRQALAIVLHGRQTMLRFSKPFSLRELLAGEGDSERGQRKLARILRVHFRRQREIAIGPDLSHRHNVVAELLEAPTVRAAIETEATTRGFTSAHAAARARRFALEIAADYSYGVVRAFEIFLAWLWTRIYDGVEIRNFDTLLQLAPGQGIVYLPCHRSHIDYLLLSYVVHQRGLTPPHIAAGENLNLPLVGALLRRGGAFFLRRSFKGEPLYAAVFHEYLHQMLARGFPLEYFIEGGRSRSGRMLAPKAGLLGMTVRSFLREHTRPLVLVPIYLGYERLLEGKGFVEELQGRPKERESIWSLLSAWRLLRGFYGKVHVNIGEPLPLTAALEARHSNWREERDPRAPWVRDFIDAVSATLAERINSAAVVTPVNLVALTLLTTPKQTADEQALYAQVALCQTLLTRLPPVPRVALSQVSPGEALAATARLEFVERVAHPLGDLWRVRAGLAPQLAYFRNNVLHLFALPALVACLMARNRRMERERLREVCGGIHALLRTELFLPGGDADLPAALDSQLGVLAELGLLRQREGSTRLAAAEANTPAFAQLRWLGEIIRPTLERHFLTLSLLQHHGSGKLTRKALEEASHLLSQRLNLLYAFNAPEFSEKNLFSAFVTTLLDAKWLTEDQAGALHFDARIATPVQYAALVLPTEAREAIRRMAGEVPRGPAAGAEQA
ncbi:MAG: glycerol-3-phosphate 1-O-acyltransferase PlsB [Betaproteobacteria bacterium]|nr:glycerol-3-phosphate 1-O-acyltransferase PlsB [Betaproteobacteria bacterium]